MCSLVTYWMALWKVLDRNPVPVTVHLTSPVDGSGLTGAGVSGALAGRLACHGTERPSARRSRTLQPLVAYQGAQILDPTSSPCRFPCYACTWQAAAPWGHVCPVLASPQCPIVSIVLASERLPNPRALPTDCAAAAVACARLITGRCPTTDLGLKRSLRGVRAPAPAPLSLQPPPRLRSLDAPRGASATSRL